LPHVHVEPTVDDLTAKRDIILEKEIEIFIEAKIKMIKGKSA